MNSEKWSRIKDIFSRAADLPAAERERFLASFAATEAEAVAAARRLLAADAESGFEKPLAVIPQLWLEEKETENLIGADIGGYKILREIGRGGMGIVFEARREIEDFSQTVALKILRRETGSTEILRRFRRERRILAALEHPRIARMLDGGQAANGTLFLAMEYVAGKSVDEFCDEENLNLEERLRIFLQICDAVSFAHSRLVVHRDLKPSNILVSNDGAIKLLDFGISKILSDEETDATQTLPHLAMMTPQYASPEQIRGETLTTASDIYTLGLILYELLTGAKAYAFPNKRADEMAKIISEIEPILPSRVWQDAETQRRGDTAKNRANPLTASPNRRIAASLKGDLDNIILKSLRKEPSRRYASVEQFATDLKRHLEGLPVSARPDTLAYRMEKFVQRHRVSVIAGMLIFLTLIGGIAATTWQAVRARRQQALAEQRFNQVRELANNIVFKYYDEAEKLPNSTVMRQMLVDDSLAYFDSLARDATADDQLKSELAKTFLRIGRVQGLPTAPNLGRTANALENYRKGIELLEPLAENSADTRLRGDLIRACAEYAVILRQSGNVADGETAFRKAVALAEKFSQAAPDDENLFVKISPVYLFYGATLPVGTGANENISVFDRVIEQSERFLQAQPDNLRAQNYLAIGYENKGNALLLLAESARAAEDFAAEKNYLDAARRAFDRYFEIAENLLRTNSDNVIAPALYASANIARATYFIETGEYQNARHDLQKAFDFYNPLLEQDGAHVGLKTYVADIEYRFGIVCFRLGETAPAEKHFARAFELMDKAMKTDPNNFDFAKQRGLMKFGYADELLRRREIEQARSAFEKAYLELVEIAERKDIRYARALDGLYHENLGDCFSAETFKDRSKIVSAAAEYEKAAAVWRESGALNLQGIEQKEKLEVVEGKIERLRNAPNSDARF